MSDTETPARMTTRQLLEVLLRLRGPNDLIITSMGSAREWQRLSRHELDFNYIPSTMSGAIPLGLGLALARPELNVTVCSGDGSLLMSLGSLVSVVSSGVTNLSVLLIDNGVYEITGGQPTAGGQASVDYSLLARGAGFTSCERFDEPTVWKQRAASFLQSPGPRFAWLKVGVEREDFVLAPAEPMTAQVARLKNALKGVLHHEEHEGHEEGRAGGAQAS